MDGISAHPECFAAFKMIIHQARIQDIFQNGLLMLMFDSDDTNYNCKLH